MRWLGIFGIFLRGFGRPGSHQLLPRRKRVKELQGQETQSQGAWWDLACPTLLCPPWAPCPLRLGSRGPLLPVSQCLSRSLP